MSPAVVDDSVSCPDTLARHFSHSFSERKFGMMKIGAPVAYKVIALQ